MNVGDYVRTKGYITKIDSCTCWKAKNQWYISYKLPNGSDCASAVTDEFKISPNIIDLIEVGDYVDKLRVVDKYENYIVVETFDERIVITKEDTIKSIVTKEQFESMEYKVGE